MSQIDGAVEFRLADEWYEVITVGSLLLRHCDLNGCLFGVDNYGEFVPLFPDRGMPPDLSATLAERMSGLGVPESHPTWVLWKELADVDWSDLAPSRDRRITECTLGDDGAETVVTKWLHKAGLEWVEESLTQNPTVEVRSGRTLFRRAILQRTDALADTEFPLVMRLMECLADRFGAEGVRLVVWFD